MNNTLNIMDNEVEKCPHCNGSGWVWTVEDGINMCIKCDKCNGTGKQTK